MKKRPSSCRDCGISEFDGAWISMQGLCPDCALERVRQSHEQMRAREGPMFERYRLGLAAAAVRTLNPE